MSTTHSTTTEAALRTFDLITAGDSGPAVDEVIHPDFVNHSGDAPEATGPEAFRGVVRWLNAGFADLSMAPLDVIADGDRVVVRVRFRGRHAGTFQNVPATGRPVDLEQIHIFRVADGLIAEHWACVDGVTGLRQMGVLPAA